MKSSTSWLTIVITAVVGIFFIIWHSHIDLLSWVVIAMGVMLLVPGIYSLISACSSRSKAQKKQVVAQADGREIVIQTAPLFPSIVASICAIGLGLWMLICPGFFVGLIAYLFAIIMIAYGLYQIYILAWLSRPYKMPWFFYIVPFIMIVFGVVILCTSVHTMNAIVVLITGILLVVSAINWALQSMAEYQLKEK